MWIRIRIRIRNTASKIVLNQQKAISGTDIEHRPCMLVTGQ